MLDDLKKDCTQRMVKCVQQFQADTRKLRTGRAHPSLVENLKTVGDAVAYIEAHS